jgi:hypothetical protein
MLINGTVSGVIVEHNTLLTSKYSMYFGYRMSPGVIYRNNIASAPACADSLGCGQSMLTASGAGAVMAGNILVGLSAGSTLLGNLIAATLEAVGFTDAAKSNYALSATSPFRNLATDGTDPGVNMAALKQAQAVLDSTPAPSPAPAMTISVTPATAALGAGKATTLTATVAGTTDKRVKWVLDQPVGTLTQTGYYTAPATISARQVVRATAILLADPAKTATAALTLEAPATATGLSISPATRSLMFGQAVTLWPTVTGSSDARVQWTAPVLGSMNVATTGATTYTYSKAPSGTQSNVVTVTAKSVADPSKTGAAVLTLIPPRVKIALSDSTTIRAGAFRYVTGAVYDVGTAAYAGVTWQLSPAIGVLDTVKGTYTAPAGLTATQQVQLKATSVADPRQSATVTLTLVP